MRSRSRSRGHSDKHSHRHSRRSSRHSDRRRAKDEYSPRTQERRSRDEQVVDRRSPRKSDREPSRQQDHDRLEGKQGHPARSQDGASYPASRHSHFHLVPGHQNTTTKVPLPRPPDMRLVTALASKGATLTETLREMNMGPSNRQTVLQQLTTRDVLMIPDLFEPSSGFVMPEDPWDKGDGRKKTIYQRLVEEIHHAGNQEARTYGGKGGNAHHDTAFSTDKDGMFKDDANGLFKAWHKTTVHAAGDGLADANGKDGNGHLIVNDKDERWQRAQQRGEAPMYTAVHKRIEDFFQMKIQGKRYNHYRDMTNWKPFHHDAAGLDKEAGKGKGGKGKGGKGGGTPPMCECQNMTVGVSFGEPRQAAFEWAGAREKDADWFPSHLLSPAVNRGSHKNVVLSLTLPDSSTYTFGRDVNLLWKHGILAEKQPTGKMGGHIDIEEGRISIIAWGWVDQYDELDEYLNECASHDRQNDSDWGSSRAGAYQSNAWQMPDQ